jgi:type I restriction enzyme M protein
MIYGAIAGDIIGSRFEFDAPNWRRDFELFTKESYATDDTVMTLAIAMAMARVPRDGSEQDYKREFIDWMTYFGNKVPNAGYGANFKYWLTNPAPYYSFGNGSAMRVSPIGWCFDDLDRTREVARWSAEVSHNHPEGIKGAECTAAVIWMARNGYSKDEIMIYVIEEFGYDLSMTVDELIPFHRHDESCMDSLPKALIAFYEGVDFEEVIRNAVAMGGDTDTIAAIAGSMAEAMYGVPTEIIMKCNEKLGPTWSDIALSLEHGLSH